MPLLAEDVTELERISRFERGGRSGLLGLALGRRHSRRQEDLPVGDQRFEIHGHLFAQPHNRPPDDRQHAITCAPMNPSLANLHDTPRGPVPSGSTLAPPDIPAPSPTPPATFVRLPRRHRRFAPVAAAILVAHLPMLAATPLSANQLAKRPRALDGPPPRAPGQRRTTRTRRDGFPQTINRYVRINGELVPSDDWILNGRGLGSALDDPDEDGGKDFPARSDADTHLATTSDATVASVGNGRGNHTDARTSAVTEPISLVVPSGWQPTPRPTGFYSLPVIIACSIVLALVIVVSIVGSVIWRRRRRKSRNAEEGSRVKEEKRGKLERFLGDTRKKKGKKASWRSGGRWVRGVRSGPHQPEGGLSRQSTRDSGVSLADDDARALTSSTSVSTQRRHIGQRLVARLRHPLASSSSLDGHSSAVRSSLSVATHTSTLDRTLSHSSSLASRRTAPHETLAPTPTITVDPPLSPEAGPAPPDEVVSPPAYRSHSAPPTAASSSTRLSEKQRAQPSTRVVEASAIESEPSIDPSTYSAHLATDDKAVLASLRRHAVELPSALGTAPLADDEDELDEDGFERFIDHEQEERIERLAEEGTSGALPAPSRMVVRTFEFPTTGESPPLRTDERDEVQSNELLDLASAPPEEEEEEEEI